MRVDAHCNICRATCLFQAVLFLELAAPLHDLLAVVCLLWCWRCSNFLSVTVSHRHWLRMYCIGLVCKRLRPYMLWLPPLKQMVWFEGTPREVLPSQMNLAVLRAILKFSEAVANPGWHNWWLCKWHSRWGKQLRHNHCLGGAYWNNHKSTSSCRDL